MMASGRDIVQSYLDRGFQLVFWPGTGDWKGPREKNWIDKKYTIADYHEGDRVGIMHGVEIAPGRFVVDVDIDWGPGVEIAKAMLPLTQFIWGRTSKRISHCLYTCPDVVPMFAYKDVGEKRGKDGKTLIEFRADRHQSMAPPSVWEKEGQREPLSFMIDKELTFIDSASKLKQRVCLAAIGMLLGIHFGKNGFGHEARLAWAGFLMRLGISDDDLQVMGIALSRHCNNKEEDDVRRVIASTRMNLQHEGKRVKGGPALATLLGVRGNAIVARINEWVGRDSDFIRNKDGVIVPKNQENIKRAIELLDHDLSYNEFSDSLLIDSKKMEDREVNSVLTRIEIEFHFQPPENYFERVVKFLAWQNPFHPVKQYLESLTWDGTPRIEQWVINSGGVEDCPYARAVSSIMLIAGVRRIRQPGCKYDEMVVWESPLQGTDKSSAAQALCPNPAWFSDDLRLNLHSQQLIEATLGKWIIEASDLAGKRKTEIEQLKAMLSRQVDGPARMAYAHFPVERPRHFILIGTTNSSAYLTDSTGSRRFWPLLIQKRFDVRWIAANRDQLWAEACAKETAGASIRLHESLWPVAEEQQEARREIDPWEASIRRALLVVIPSGDGRRRVTADSIWDALNIALDRRDRTASLRITDIMQRLGFKRTRVRPSGEEVQIGFVQEQDVLDLHEGEGMHGREPGSDDVPF